MESAAVWSASRVLPTPPVPVMVTSGIRRSASVVSTTAWSRPMNELTCGGRLPGSESSDSGRWKSSGRPVPVQLEDAFRSGEIAEAMLPQIDEAEVVVEHCHAASSSVASDTSLPPCAASMSRAGARLTAVP